MCAPMSWCVCHCLGLQLSQKKGGNVHRIVLRTWMCPLPWQISSISRGPSRLNRTCKCTGLGSLLAFLPHSAPLSAVRLFHDLGLTLNSNHLSFLLVVPRLQVYATIPGPSRLFFFFLERESERVSVLLLVILLPR